jgi:hypothetical protein
MFNLRRTDGLFDENAGVDGGTSQSARLQWCGAKSCDGAVSTEGAKLIRVCEPPSGQARLSRIR